MKRHILRAALLFVLGAAAFATVGWSWILDSMPGGNMTRDALAFLETLDEKQRAVSLMPYDSPQRVDWHFIPKDTRKGLQVKNMTQEQRKAADKLLRSCLSNVGYKKARVVMQLEGLLRELERDRTGGPIRDPERYYVTIFGKPDGEKRWGLSVEGHHLSLNFVVDKGRVISSTPTFYAANPGVVMEAVDGSEIAKGTRVLAKEELLAFELVNALSEDQRATAIIAEKAPREIRAAGAAQPPEDEKVGLSVAEMDEKQHEVIKNLVTSYAANLPPSLAAARLKAIKDAGIAEVRFAWAGATKPGIGHYYRIQGPTFLIEFVNTQPDAAGNPANHIHCVWRDMAGDFAIPINAKTTASGG